MKKVLETNYGKILAMCKDNLDLAHNVCVYFLERGTEITTESISAAIDNINRLHIGMDKYENSDDDVVVEKHHILLNAEEGFKGKEDILMKYRFMKKGLDDMGEDEIPNPMVVTLCSDMDMMNIMELIRKLD